VDMVVQLNMQSVVMHRFLKSLASVHISEKGWYKKLTISMPI